MSLNPILGMFAILALLIVVLVVWSGINIHRKISHNTALLKAHHDAKQRKKDAAMAARTPGDASLKTESATEDAPPPTVAPGKNFTPS